MHPTMDFPKCLELSEIVRQYVLAFMQASSAAMDTPVKKEEPKKLLSGKRDYAEISAASINVKLKEFGDVDEATINKRVNDERSAIRSHNRAVDKQAMLAGQLEEEGKKKVDPRTIIQRPAPPSDAKLAALAEQARLALAEARELAGEPVVYCCAAIRKEGIHECWAGCKDEARYRACRALL